ncbi:MAG TPA: DUF4265 domain-containing protein [Terriglobales bacterium]|nr:DUF4265 domain-containing protein [Terriglobales bacterium]
MSSSEETLVVEVKFDIEKDSEGFPKSRDAEALLCKPLDAECSRCVVASVPFYLRNVAYGDTISTKRNSSDDLEFKDVIDRGGYRVYRVLLHDPTKRSELVGRLLDLDALLEQDGNLIAVAIPPNADLDAIVDCILQGKREGFWGAQDGYVFESK